MQGGGSRRFLGKRRLNVARHDGRGVEGAAYHDEAGHHEKLGGGFETLPPSSWLYREWQRCLKWERHGLALDNHFQLDTTAALPCNRTKVKGSSGPEAPSAPAKRPAGALVPPRFAGGAASRGYAPIGLAGRDFLCRKREQ